MKNKTYEEQKMSWKYGWTKMYISYVVCFAQFSEMGKK